MHHLVAFVSRILLITNQFQMTLIIINLHKFSPFFAVYLLLNSNIPIEKMADGDERARLIAAYKAKMAEHIEVDAKFVFIL